MSHEGTTGMQAEAVVTEAQAIVQALVSGRNAAIPGNEVAAAVVEEGKGTVGRAMEAVRSAVEQGASEPSVPAPLTQFTSSDAGKDHDVSPATGAVMQAKAPVAEAPERAEMVGAPVAGKPQKPQTKTSGVKGGAAKARSKVAKTKKAPTFARRAESKVARNSSARAPVAGMGAKIRKVKAAQALAATKGSKTKRPQKPFKFTVPDVWRSIVRKNERQGAGRFDVLVCQHAVPANDNTYRTARACPECRLTVQRYADEVAATRARKAPRRRKA